MIKIKRIAFLFFCFGLCVAAAARLPSVAYAVDQKEEEQFFVAQKALEGDSVIL